MTSQRSGKQQRKHEVHSREYVSTESEDDLELETENEVSDEDPFGDVSDIDDSVADNVKHAQPHSKSSRVEEASITEGPQPMFAGSTPHQGVDKRVSEPSTHSNLTPGSNLQQRIKVHPHSRQRNFSVSSILGNSPRTSSSPSRKAVIKPSMQLAPKSRQADRERVKGDKDCPIELSNSDSDRENSNSVAQRERSTRIRSASLAFASYEGSANTSPPAPQSRKATKISSVSDRRESSMKTRPLAIKNPTCEICRMTKGRTICIHGTFSNEDPGEVQKAAIAQTHGQVSIASAASPQPSSQGTSGHGDGHDDKVFASTTRTVNGASTPDDRRSLARANSQFETSIRSASETGGVEGFVDLEPHLKPSIEIGLPIRLPVTQDIESDDSEDSDPPMTFSLRRRLRTRRNTNITNSPPIGTHTTKTHRSADVVSDPSDSDKPLVPSWGNPRPVLSTGSVNSLIEGYAPGSPSQVQQEKNVRDPEMCSRTEQPLPDDPSNSSRDSSQRGKAPSASVPNEERPQLHATTPEAGKHDNPSRSSKRVVRLPAKYADQSRERPVAQRLQYRKPSSAKRTRIQPSVASSKEAIEPVKQRPKLSLADIIPKEGPPKKTSLTLRDIVPRKTSRKRRLPRYSAGLTNFQNNVRTAFAPFLVGPDEILEAPPKKRKFTLADVIGMPQEPLFNIEEVIEQYLARQLNQAQQSAAQGIDATARPANQDAEEQVPATGGEGTIDSESRIDIHEERHNRDYQDGENGTMHDSQDPVESTSATEPDLSGMLDDAEAFLSGVESAKSGNNVRRAPLARGSANRELPRTDSPSD